MQHAHLFFRWVEWAKKRKEDKIPLKSDDKDFVEQIQQRLQNAIERKENAKSVEEKLEAAQAVEEAKTNSKQVW